MGKTVYSLILAEEVVALVDEAAAREGTSRSALVNHILAEYVCLVTPEKATRQMMDALRGITDACGLRAAPTAGAALNLRTALPYKYNPALTYTVELRGEGRQLGRIRLSVRSQNSRLFDEMEQFFALWQALEADHLDDDAEETLQATGPGGYQRTLRRPDAADNAALGIWVGQYIRLLDECLKAWFGAGQAGDPQDNAESRFLAGLSAFGGAIQI